MKYKKNLDIIKSKSFPCELSFIDYGKLKLEIKENNFLENDLLKKRFDLDLNALKIWKKYHQSLEDESNQKIEIDWGTYILNSSRGTKFEDRLFEYLVKNHQ